MKLIIIRNNKIYGAAGAYHTHHAKLCPDHGSQVDKNKRLIHSISYVSLSVSAQQPLIICQLSTVPS